MKAQTIAEAVARQGFSAKVGEPLPEHPDQWSVTCEIDAVVDPDVVRRSTDFFEELAKVHGAEYDGWETSI